MPARPPDPSRAGADSPTAENGHSKDLLHLHGLEPNALGELLDLACEMRSRELRTFHSLRGATIVCLFERPSMRTRVSFETAAYRLGLLPIMLRPDELRFGRDEPIEDTARTLSAYCDGIVAHVPHHASLEQLAASASVPVINARSDEHDPCQALADLLTVRDRLGALQGVRLAYVGAFGSAARSLLDASAIAGMHVVIASPDPGDMLTSLVERAGLVARERGGSITIAADAAAAALGADVVYAGSWFEEGAREPTCLTRELMGLARPNATFLHRLPANRGSEVEASMIDDPRSAVWEQAANRLHVEEAVLLTLLLRIRDELSALLPRPSRSRA